MGDTSMWEEPLRIQDLNHHYRRIAQAAMRRGATEAEAVRIAVRAMPRR